jgi:hypothetical protein
MTIDAIKRWRTIQNQTSFNKFYKGSYEDEPKIKMYECVKDDEIKGVLFKILSTKIPDEEQHNYVNLNKFPGVCIPNMPINNLAVKKEKEVFLYYYSWKSNRVVPKRNFHNDGLYNESVKISASECVIGTGRKAIPSIASSMKSKVELETYYEVLTTKGIVYLQKELLCPYTK